MDSLIYRLKKKIIKTKNQYKEKRKLKIALSNEIIGGGGMTKQN